MWGDGRGLRITRKLKELEIKTNVTCMMTANQMLLATKVGATYASIFFNRVKDSGGDPVKVIQESRRMIDVGGFTTKIITGSIRKPEDVLAEKGVPGEAYSLCSGKGIKMRDILDMAISLSGLKNVKVRQVQLKMRPFDDPIYIGDNSKLRSLGWKPKIPLKKTLSDLLEYWRKNL